MPGCDAHVGAFSVFLFNAGNFLAIIKRAAVTKRCLRGRAHKTTVAALAVVVVFPAGGPRGGVWGGAFGVGPGDSVVHQKRTAELKNTFSS